MSDEREAIRQRVSLVDLVGQRVPLKKSGRDWKGLCPFHDDTNPSFTVSDKIQRYKCWSCGASGDIFNWVMETQKVDFPQALEILAKEAGITLAPRSKTADPNKRLNQDGAMTAALKFFREQISKSDAAREYIKDRQLAPDTLTHWEIGFAPAVDGILAQHLQKLGFSLAECRDLFLVEKDSSGGYYDRFKSRLMFPIRDERGKLVAFGGRIVGEGIPKYINSSDTPLYSKSRVLYGMHHAKDHIAQADRAILVEGYTDVIACHTAELRNTVATLGTSLAEDHVKLLKRWCSNVTILYDADEAGQKAADRAIGLLQAADINVAIATMPGGEDPDTLLRSKGAQAVRDAVSQQFAPIEFRLNSLRERSQPSQDSFWKEAVTILRKASNELELEKYLMPLASVYPGVKDKAAARRALLAMVKRGWKPSADKIVKGKGSTAQVAVPLHGPEKVVFAALLEKEYHYLVAEFCRKPDHFKSPLASRLASALDVAFEAISPDSPLEGIVNALPDTEDTELFKDFLMSFDAPLSVDLVKEAIDWLEREKSLRQAEKMTESIDSDDALLQYNNRMKAIKGE